MDQDLWERLVYELKLLKKSKEVYSERLFRLQSAAEMKLKIKRTDGKNYFYVKSRESTTYKYVGSEKKHPLINKIKEAAFIVSALHRIDLNISLIETLLEGYLPYDHSSVNDSLSLAYRNTSYPAADVKYQMTGIKWKENRLIYQKEFPENYPEHKTERTSDGVMVKSVSEVVIYERLLSSGLYFVYELPLVSKDYGPNLYPDFSILSPIDCTSVIIVEYAGKLNTPNYREDFARRVHRYILNGYIPGVNLFFIKY